MLWLAIGFIRLPLEVLCANPEKPPSLVRERHRVLMCSDSASSHGIRRGQKVANAQSLCDALQVFERRPDLEQQRLQKLAASLLFISPHVSLSSPNNVLIEISGCLKLFQGLPALFASLQRSLDSQAHHYRLGLGHTPLAAEILTITPAELQTLSQRPLTAEFFRQQLQQQPIDTLPLADSLRDALQAPGFRHLGEIHRLPLSALGKRHGKTLLHWLQRLWGDIPDPRPAITPPLRFYADTEFSEPVEYSQALLLPAERLLQRMEYFLRQRQLSSRAIRWHFIGQHQQQRLIIRRASAEQDLGLWLELTRRRFEQTQLSAGVLKLALDCARPQAMHAPRNDLFYDPQARPDRASLLERLQALPALQLSLLQEQDEHLPEQAQVNHDPLATLPRQKKHSALTDHLDYQDVPLWLLETPWPLQQREQKLIWRGAALELLPGQKNISLNWWQQLTQRQYFVARHPQGLCCWVFRDQQNQRWYLQGFF